MTLSYLFQDDLNKFTGYNIYAKFVSHQSENIMTANLDFKPDPKEPGAKDTAWPWAGWDRAPLFGKARNQIWELRNVARLVQLKVRRVTRTFNCLKRTQHFALFQLPLEIRLEIYDCLIIQSDPSLSQPRQHPLYELLFVSRALRLEISALIYSKPSLRFSSPINCTSFCANTAPHLQFLTSLAISVSADKTETLEPVFRKLYLANAPLRRLVIYLNTPNGRFVPKERVVTAYMLPRRLCLSPEGQRIINQGRANRFVYGPILDDSRENYIYEYDKHAPVAMALSKSCNAALGKMSGLRYIQVCGQPVGKESLEFEMAILKICGRMREVAEMERRNVVWGKYASRAKKDTWWWFEGWIEGEEENSNE